jgi:hypothetical protein
LGDNGSRAVVLFGIRYGTGLEQETIMSMATAGTPVTVQRVEDAGHAYELAALEYRLRVQLERGDGLYRRMRTAEDDLEAFRRRVAEAIMEKAEEKGWCSEAEEFVDDLGLGEYIEEEVNVQVSFQVSVTRRGRSEPDQDAIDAAAIDYIRNQMDSNDWQVTEY